MAEVYSKWLLARYRALFHELYLTQFESPYDILFPAEETLKPFELFLYLLLLARSHFDSPDSVKRHCHKEKLFYLSVVFLGRSLPLNLQEALVNIIIFQQSSAS